MVLFWHHRRIVARPSFLGSSYTPARRSGAAIQMANEVPCDARCAGGPPIYAAYNTAHAMGSATRGSYRRNHGLGCEEGREEACSFCLRLVFESIAHGFVANTLMSRIMTLASQLADLEQQDRGRPRNGWIRAAQGMLRLYGCVAGSVCLSPR